MSLSTCTWTHLEVTDHELVGGHVFESTLLGLAGGRTERHGNDDCAETLVSTAALTVPGGTSNGAVGRSPTSFGVGEGQLTIVGRLAEELGDVGRADNGIVSCADGHDVRVGCEGECEGGERGPTGSFYRQAEPRPASPKFPGVSLGKPPSSLRWASLRRRTHSRTYPVLVPALA